MVITGIVDPLGGSDMRPRVFVSSVIDGFEDHRKTAREAILSAGGEPILVEDFSGLAVSPRNACLDGVASCDIFIVIVGSRGGWPAPSGKLVVEEEYEEARRRKLPVLAFIQECEREHDAERLVERLSDYVEGVFRPTYNDFPELQKAVEHALAPLIRGFTKRGSAAPMIAEKLGNPHRIYSETCLRFVLAPERADELIDPVSIESPVLSKELLRIGHDDRVELFSYTWPKKTEVGVAEIVITQSEEGYRRKGTDWVRLELTTRGIIVIDQNVTGRPTEGNRDDFVGAMAVIERDVVDAIEKSFAFSNAFISAKDPYKRYDQMAYNVAISGLGHRTMMAEPVRSGGFTLGNLGDDPVKAFDIPRPIVRADLENPREEIAAVMSLFRRCLRR
jgi:hypothetical protein